MISVSYIQNFAQRISNNLSDILGLDVTIIDRDGIRISGTGNYKGLIGQRVPEQSFFEKIIENGEAGVIIRKESEENCRGCVFLDRCKELATIGFPIKKNTEPLGVIGLVGFSTLQKEIIIENRDIIMKFLNIISDLIETEILVLEKEELKDCSILKRKENNSITSFNSIVGQNRKFLDVIKKSRKVSNSISTVLVRGESGTGKEILAQAIHNESDRRNYPFVAVNCATIPENLVESELFGYEGGAFTGSKREGKPGKFELAHRGTIFLDEIGDMPLHLQPKLLRVLQEREIERVGGIKKIPIDVRVIAATNKNLEELVKRGLFRSPVN